MFTEAPHFVKAVEHLACSVKAWTRAHEHALSSARSAGANRSNWIVACRFIGLAGSVAKQELSVSAEGKFFYSTGVKRQPKTAN